MLLAGFCALVESDFKKIVAISTLSQLGIMLFVLSMGNWMFSFLHMMIHAFFKSTLFLRRGMLIGQLGGTQDSRFYGGFASSSVSYVYFLVRCFSLGGFPFLIGFYSKDTIISYFSGEVGGLAALVLMFGCVVTVAYRVRLVLTGFVSVYKGGPTLSLFESAHFVFPVFFLFVVCVFGGSLFRWLFLSGAGLFLRGVDLLFGVVFVFLGILLSFLFKTSYYFVGFLGSLSFLRWLRAGGVSSFFRDFVFYSGESSWMEIAGGGGVFSFLVSLSKVFDAVFSLRIKGIMVLSFLSRFFFYV
jgi:NADH-ubiquinone oxidoreductase chain 5